MTELVTSASRKPRSQHLPPLAPGRRPPLPVGARPKIRRSVSFADNSSPPASAPHPPTFLSVPAPAHSPLKDGTIDRKQPRRPKFLHSLSMGVISASHIGGTPLEKRQQQVAKKKEKEEDDAAAEVEQNGPSLHSSFTPTLIPSGEFEIPSSPQKPVRVDSGYSAQEIALRRFMTVVAWGPGMAVVKHNRGKGRVRRVLKFNDEEGYLSWSGVLPPYYKTRVSAVSLQEAKRVGQLVTLKIAGQGDVGFQCARLTDAIVLVLGLNGVIDACNQQ